MRSAARIYQAMLAEHLAGSRQMAFVSGPRQVGKTTTCRALAAATLNWDDLDDREILLGGPRRVVDALGLHRLSERPPVVLFDELHKFPRWKSFLKGFFDVYGGGLRILVTGSSRLDVYRRGGDSLMGRYFLYRMHPFSVGEAASRDLGQAGGELPGRFAPFPVGEAALRDLGQARGELPGYFAHFPAGEAASRDLGQARGELPGYFAHFPAGEAASQAPAEPPGLVRPPRPIGDDDFEALWEHGGFPEPFLERDIRFTRRWRNLRSAQLVREEVRDLTRIQQLDQLEVLVRLLSGRSGQQIVYDNLAKQVRIAADTVRRWIATLADLHLGFLVRPWFRNLSRSLRKEPKWYLRDWGQVADTGQRAETFVACHFAKAVDGWNDLGLGEFELAYLRDKERREVDLLVVRDGEPWILAEVKHGDDSLSPHLRYYQDRLRTPFAFQVVVDADYVDRNCFESPGSPLIVPARTLLSQLL